MNNIQIDFEGPITDRSDLFQRYQRDIRPEYELHSWDAFEDVLYLKIIEEAAILLINHGDHLQLPERELESYRTILDGIKADYPKNIYFDGLSN